MALPDLSSSMYVAQLRFIQSLHESPERRNPDTFVQYFIPLIQRLRGVWVSRKKLSSLRADPFYYYLVARTIYYDHLINEAVSTGVRRIVSIGAGSDTRAYRFVQLLNLPRWEGAVHTFRNSAPYSAGQVRVAREMSPLRLSSTTV